MSDNILELTKNFSCLTWNLQALADYFEPAWNNIEKYSETPFNEIKKLEAGNYLILNKKSKEIHIKKWRKKSEEFNYKYTLDNMDDFKNDFLQICDDLIDSAVEKSSTFTVSGGIDSGTLACIASRRHRNKRLAFYSVKFEDAKDESSVTKLLDEKLTSRVEFINISCPQEMISEMKELIKIVGTPYSDIEGLTHYKFYEALKEKGVENMIMGQGADVTFGGLPMGEYAFQIKKYIQNNEWDKAYSVYIARQLGCGDRESSFAKFKLKQSILKRLPHLIGLYRKIRYQQKENIHFLTIKLEMGRFNKITNYEEIREYATQDAATRQLTMLQHSLGIIDILPFESERFSKLASKCDPIIFSNRINKYCMRYAVKNILPHHIVDNGVKMGFPGYEDVIVKNNRERILMYLSGAMKRTSKSIVDIPKLYEFVQWGWNDDVFRCLNLIIYEEIIFEQGVELGLNI